MIACAAAAHADGAAPQSAGAQRSPNDPAPDPAAPRTDPTATPAPSPDGSTATTDRPPNDQLKGADVPARDPRDDAPVIALTHSAFGTRAGKIGAQAFGYGQAASEGSGGGGGLMIHGSPIDRLTLLATGQRYVDGRFAPSVGVAYRVLGSLDQSWGLAAMGSYKAEGFAEIEGEVELGVLFSIIQQRWHFDVNAVAGGGLEESEEFDAEAKLRAGYDIADWLRVGLDARGRYRLKGDKLLAGGRKGDFIGGPQVVASWSHFYGAALVGASTVDVGTGAAAVGWLTFGGVLP
jgi:hypothetical protein